MSYNRTKGAAFPTALPEHEAGLTKLDYFAAQAMQSIRTANRYRQLSPREVAEAAYIQGLEMLAERERRM
jgi:hypothetical protein